MNFIYYNALNNIRYLSDIDFTDQIQNSQKMVYLILGHPVSAGQHLKKKDMVGYKSMGEQILYLKDERSHLNNFNLEVVQEMCEKMQYFYLLSSPNNSLSRLCGR